MYLGFVMGYGYSNGLVEGLITHVLMHLTSTTVYTGGSEQRMLYPGGRVIDQHGYQVGTHADGQCKRCKPAR